MKHRQKRQDANLHYDVCPKNEPENLRTPLKRGRNQLTCCQKREWYQWDQETGFLVWDQREEEDVEADVVGNEGCLASDRLQSIVTNSVGIDD